jgi:DNA adenine methylase
MSVTVLAPEKAQAITAGPFLKWAGGKSQLLEAYDRYLPRVPLQGYLEPFVGGGAVFFHLVRDHAALLPRARGTLVLTDYNEELITCYTVVRDAVGALIKALRAREREFNRDENTRRRLRFYHAARRERPSSPVERAARLIFLNRTCYNGLYRVNSRGEFNVPMGRYRRPRILNEENLRAVSQALQGVVLLADDFDAATRRFARAGWFVYFDPPYTPLSATSSFTGYTENGFGGGDQARLARLFADLSDMGCYVMLSNSSHATVARFYRRYDPLVIPARRAINSDPTKRGAIHEFLVLSPELRKLTRE